VLVEAAHVPAVRELHDAPLVAIARAPAVLMPAEVFDAPLAIDPADLTVDGLARVAPGELAAHAEPALEVRERGADAEEHHLATARATAERGRRPGRVDVEREGHVGAVMIAAAELERPRERHQRASAVPRVPPADRPR